MKPPHKKIISEAIKHPYTLHMDNTHKKTFIHSMTYFYIHVCVEMVVSLSSVTVHKRISLIQTPDKECLTHFDVAVRSRELESGEV